MENFKETTAIFKLNFFSLIDKTISSILPIQYEFPLENIETNIKEEKEYQEFIYSIIIPKLEQLINDNYSYYKIIAIEQKLKNDKNINIERIDSFEIKKLYNNQSIVIKLNEKSFREIRNDILIRLFIEFINKSNDKNYTYNFLNDKEYLDLLPLRKIVSYKKVIENNNKLSNYEFKLFISFVDFIKIINNNDLFIQFKFWFKFFLKKMNLMIVEIEYEYYINFMNKWNETELIKFVEINEITTIISNIFIEYINFILDIIDYYFNFVNKNKVLKKNINLYLIDNDNWLESFKEKLGEDFFNLKGLKIYNSINKNKITFEKLIFNNIYIKFYGKNSGYGLKKFLENINDNKLENIIIDINNFYDYEYLELIENDENMINKIKYNAVKIFSFLSKFLIKIKKNKLKSISLYIKGFNNNNILLKEIQEKFDDFIKGIIKLNSIIKNVKISFSNIFSKGSNCKSDSIYSFPIFNDKENLKFNVINDKKKKFKLILFDDSIKIRKNKIIDFYYFEQYSIKRIEKLSLGYFLNISELNRFFGKIKLYELCNMKKFTCFIKSNHKIDEKSLSTFFKLDWPKNTLTSIKIIFENFVKIFDYDNDNINSNYKHNSKYLVKLDMYKIFNSIIKEFYFKTGSKDDIKKIIFDNHQDDFEDTMIKEKKDDKYLEQRLNLIKFKKNQEKSIISTKITDDNNANMSNLQQSNNIFLQPKEGSISILLKNKRKKKYNYVNDIKSLEEYHSNNYYNNFIQSKQYQNYPLNNIYIIKAETYLKYFLNNNKKELLKNTYLYNEIIEVNNTGKKTGEKYKTFLNFKKSLIIINNNIRSILGLIYTLNKTKNKSLKKLTNTQLRYKVIHYQYYQRNPVLLDYIISFMNKPIYIYNDFKHSNKLFKKVIEG